MKNKILVCFIVALAISGSLFFMRKTPVEINEDIPNREAENNRGNNVSDHSVDTQSTEKKVAILYFSATNTTKIIAEYIQNTTNGDIFEIIPEEKYTSSNLDYGNNNSRANREQNDSAARPRISNDINVDSYDIIYLGYPIWWGDVPKIILTFLDTHNLSGKTVIPFCTSHSSGISVSLNTLKNYSKNINWVDGKRFGSSDQSEIDEWIQSINQ